MRSICVSPLGSASDRQLAEAATASRHAPRLEQLERSHQDPVAGQYLVHERAGGWAEDRVDDLLYHLIRGFLEEAALVVVPVDCAHGA